MHYYLYDASCKQRSSRKTIDHIETRLTDLGLRGKIGRLNLLTNTKELITTGKRNGAKTIVIIGQDATFLEAIPEIARAGMNAGFIPIDTHSTIGRILGIPSGELACDVLAQRRLKRLDLGKMNTTLFLHSVIFHALHETILIERDYTITPLEPCEFRILNLPDASRAHDRGRGGNPNPTDGILNVVLEQKKRWWPKHTEQQSHFPSKKITVLGEGTVIVTSDMRSVPVTLPISIRCAEVQLSCIVGKERLFA